SATTSQWKRDTRRSVSTRSQLRWVPMRTIGWEKVAPAPRSGPPTTSSRTQRTWMALARPSWLASQVAVSSDGAGPAAACPSRSVSARAIATILLPCRHGHPADRARLNRQGARAARRRHLRLDDDQPERRLERRRDVADDGRDLAADAGRPQDHAGAGR